MIPKTEFNKRSRIAKKSKGLVEVRLWCTHAQKEKIQTIINGESDMSRIFANTSAFPLPIETQVLDLRLTDGSLLIGCDAIVMRDGLRVFWMDTLIDNELILSWRVSLVTLSKDDFPKIEWPSESDFSFGSDL